MPEAEQVAALLRELAADEPSSLAKNSKRERRATFNGFASPTRDDELPAATAAAPTRANQGNALEARPAEGTRPSRRLSVSLDTRPDQPFAPSPSAPSAPSRRPRRRTFTAPARRTRQACDSAVDMSELCSALATFEPESELEHDMMTQLRAQLAGDGASLQLQGTPRGIQRGTRTRTTGATRRNRQGGPILRTFSS